METIIYVVIVFCFIFWAYRWSRPTQVLAVKFLAGSAAVISIVSALLLDGSGEDKLALFFLGTFILYIWWHLEKKYKKNHYDGKTASQQREEGQ